MIIRRLFLATSFLLSCCLAPLAVGTSAALARDTAGAAAQTKDDGGPDKGDKEGSKDGKHDKGEHGKGHRRS